MTNFLFLYILLQLLYENIKYENRDRKSFEFSDCDARNKSYKAAASIRV